MGKTYDLFEFDQGNVRAEYVIDESKGLVERVYVEALNAETANAYMESLGADFEDKCRCCGVRWYKAMRPMWAEDHIDVRYSEKRVAVHKIDGSFVIWTPAYTAPAKSVSAERALAIEENRRVLERVSEATDKHYPEVTFFEAERLVEKERAQVEAIKAEILSAIGEYVSKL